MAPCAVYEFRANKDLYTQQSLRDWLQANCKKWTFQLEMGDTGYLHWQGRFSLMKKREKHVVLKLFINIPAPNYLEPTLASEYTKEAFYSMKTDTRVEGPFSDSYTECNSTIYIPRHLSNITLYPWQQKIIDSRLNRDMRKVNLIFDPEGNKGKSTVASVGELKYGAIDMPPLNDFKELIAALCNICMDRNIRDPGLVFMDMPRAMRKDQLYGMYSAIEQIKKCKLYDMRNHYKSWWIECPEVWVFSNVLPDKTMLSADRWQFWEIVNGDLVPFIEYKDTDSEEEYDLDK